MKLRLKEEPKEWRKSALLSALGLALLSSVLCWRRVVPVAAWCVILAVLAFAAVLACMQPRWFRGYYRSSARAGFWSSQLVARVTLALVFVLVVTPLGLLFRLMGKDALRLKRSRNSDTYWQATKPTSPLDRLF
ncbi:MAG TPA: SxtJ family membrane protein [Candidatus Acidoferrum sp.]|jgi:hypothetical protein|nr:SxtJ family membrane protein [Candidatus Acidoferrum sp.]